MPSTDVLKKYEPKLPAGFKQDKYLKTRASKLMKALHALGAGGYAVRGGILAALEGEPVVERAYEAGKKALSAPLRREKDEFTETGGKILERLGFAPEDPETTAGKIAKGIGGLAIEVATDPITYATFGATLPEYLGGRAAVTLGGKILPQATKLTRQQLVDRGAWTFAKLGGIRTPQPVNRAAAYALDAMGNLFRSLPGAGLISKTFTDGKLRVLAPFGAKQKYLTETSLGENTPLYKGAIKAQDLFRREVARERAHDSLMNKILGRDTEAVKRVSDQIAKINEAGIIEKQAKKLPAYRRRAQLYQMVVDGFEGRPLKSYPGNLRRVVERALKRQGPVAGKLTEYETKVLSELRSEHPDLGLKLMGFLKTKTPAERAVTIDDYRRYATAWRKVVGKIEGDIRAVKAYRALPSIKEAADQFKLVNESVLKFVRKGGIPLSRVEDFMGRTLSDAAKERMRHRIKYGGAGTALIKPLRMNARRKFDEYTREQVDYFASDPDIRPVFFKRSLGDEPLTEKPTIGRALRGDPPKVADFYQPDALKELKHRVVLGAEAVSSAKVVKEVIDKFGLNPLQITEAGKMGVVTKPVTITEQLQKLLRLKDNVVIMPKEIGTEFQQFQEIIGSPRALNEYLRMYDTMISHWKRLTLFGVPFFPGVVARNVLGGGFLSFMRPGGPKKVGGAEIGALSGKGSYAALAMTTAAWRKRRLNPEQWGAFKKKMDETFLSNADGSVKISLGKAFDELEQAGMFRQGAGIDALAQPTTTASRRLLEREGIAHRITTGVGESMNQNAENLLRSQHYVTRRLQGYGPDQAMMDTRETQYDYMFGLSNFEREVPRRLIPFYSWLRFNIPAMMEAILRQPGKAAAAQKSVSALEGLFKAEDGRAPNEDTLNEWVKGNMHVRLYQGKDGNFRYFVLKNWLPLADLEDVSTKQNIEDLLLGSLTPVIKLPIETIFNRSLFFREPGGERAMIERYPGETGSLLGVPMGRKMENLIRQSFRTVKVVDALNPLEVFGASDKPGWLGAVRRKATLTPVEKLGTMLGVKAIVVNQRRERELGKFAYQRSMGGLKAALTKEKLQQDVPGMARVRRMIEELERQ